MGRIWQPGTERTRAGGCIASAVLAPPSRHCDSFRAAMPDDEVSEQVYYRRKVLVLWDHLPAHHAAENDFEDEHPGWFEFDYIPTYSPELNPVESCWNQMKNVYLSHYFPRTDAELTATAHRVARRINDERLLPAFFKHAGLKP